MKNLRTMIAAFAAFGTVCPVLAQDKVETEVGVDLVSSYIWRGQDLGGVSIQPGLSASYKGFSLGAWGSASFDSNKGNTKELDLTLSYSTGGLSLGVTDYWFGGQDYGHYESHKTTHVWEGFVGYDFDVATLKWYTNFAGDDKLNKDGKRAYSSYIEATAPFKLGGLDWNAELGIVPFKTSFYNNASGIAVTNIGIGASKEIKISPSFTMSTYGKVILNPSTEGAYFVFGIHI